MESNGNNDGSNIDGNKTTGDTGSGNHVPAELQNSQHEEGIRDVEKHSNSQISFHIRGKPVALR